MNGYSDSSGKYHEPGDYSNGGGGSGGQSGGSNERYKVYWDSLLKYVVQLPAVIKGRLNEFSFPAYGNLYLGFSIGDPQINGNDESGYHFNNPTAYVYWDIEFSVVSNASGQGGTSYFENDLKYEGAPYLSGGMSQKGMDCSGLVNLATGNEKRVWTTSGGNPPGNWEKIKTNTSSYDKFISDVNKGDLFLWPTSYTAFYAGDGGLFHAHGKPGTPTGYSYDLESWWIPNRGYPEVFRQLSICKD